MRVEFRRVLIRSGLMAKHVGPEVKIKASGGISSLEDAETFMELGATRLGTSKIVKLVRALEEK